MESKKREVREGLFKDLKDIYGGTYEMMLENERMEKEIKEMEEGLETEERLKKVKDCLDDKI